MRFITLALVACMLSACGDKPEPLTAEQAVIKQKLERAPAGTLLVFHDKKDRTDMNASWGVICSREADGKLLVGHVDYTGVWMCSNFSATGRPMSAHALAAKVTRTINPNDPAYKNSVQDLMFTMMGVPRDKR